MLIGKVWAFAYSGVCFYCVAYAWPPLRNLFLKLKLFSIDRRSLYMMEFLTKMLFFICAFFQCTRIAYFLIFDIICLWVLFKTNSGSPFARIVFLRLQLQRRMIAWRYYLILRKELTMTLTVLNVVGIVVTTISIIVGIIGIKVTLESIDKNKHQKSNRHSPK